MFVLDPEGLTSYCILIDYAEALACMVRVGKTGTIPHNIRKEELSASFLDDGNTVAKKD